MKQCKKCQRMLDEECFSRRNDQPDGRYWYCKECHHQMRCHSPSGEVYWENLQLKKQGLKRCCCCKKIQPLNEFYGSGKRRIRKSECKECSRTYRQGADRRATYLAEQKRLSDLLAAGRCCCTKCKKEKPVSEFYIYNGKPRTQCKACVRKICIGAYHADPIKTRQRNAGKYQRNKESMLARGKRYNKTPAGRASRRAVEMRRRARELSVPTEKYQDKLKPIMASPLFKCFYCGLMFNPQGNPLFNNEKLHVDHRTPISRNGPDVWSNLAMACQECNNAKGDKTDTEFDAYEREDMLIAEWRRAHPAGVV